MTYFCIYIEDKNIIKLQFINGIIALSLSQKIFIIKKFSQNNMFILNYISDDIHMAKLLMDCDEIIFDITYLHEILDIYIENNQQLEYLVDNINCVFKNNIAYTQVNKGFIFTKKCTPLNQLLLLSQMMCYIYNTKINSNTKININNIPRLDCNFMETDDINNKIILNTIFGINLTLISASQINSFSKEACNIYRLNKDTKKKYIMANNIYNTSSKIITNVEYNNDIANILCNMIPLNLELGTSIVVEFPAFVSTYEILGYKIIEYENIPITYIFDAITTFMKDINYMEEMSYEDGIQANQIIMHMIMYFSNKISYIYEDTTDAKIKLDIEVNHELKKTGSEKGYPSYYIKIKNSDKIKENKEYYEFMKKIKATLSNNIWTIVVE